MPKIVLDSFAGRRYSDRAIRRRVYGLWRFIWLWLILAYAGLVAALFELVDALGLSLRGDGWMIGAACYIVPILCVDGLRRIANRVADSRWYARGVPRQVEVEYTIEDEGLHISSPTDRSIILWSAFNEVVLDKDYWVLIGPGAGYYLPRLLFADLSEESEFVSEILKRLDPAAQARSGSAYKALAALAAN